MTGVNWTADGRQIIGNYSGDGAYTFWVDRSNPDDLFVGNERLGGLAEVDGRGTSGGVDLEEANGPGAGSDSGGDDDDGHGGLDGSEEDADDTAIAPMDGAPTGSQTLNGVGIAGGGAQAMSGAGLSDGGDSGDDGSDGDTDWRSGNTNVMFVKPPPRHRYRRRRHAWGSPGNRKAETAAGSPSSSASSDEDPEDLRPLRVPADIANHAGHISVTPAAVFKGHRNVRTVKEVNFYGQRDEFVTSGSDDGKVNFFLVCVCECECV